MKITPMNLNLRRVRTRSILLGLALIGTSLAVALPVVVQATVHLGIPPTSVVRISTPSTLVSDAHLRAEISVYCKDKRVAIGWLYSANGDFSRTDAAATQSVATSYWPTAAEVVGPNKILVAGKERLGATRLEVWTLVPPIIQTSLNVTPTRYVVLPQGISDITAIYDQSVVGQDMVRGMMRNRGSGSQAFLHFDDSKSLFQIDWNQSPYAVTSVLTTAQEPALAQAYELYSAGNHTTQGYVYVMFVPDDLGSTPWLVLKDTNRDGVIDWHGTLTAQQFAALGLNDRAQYTEYCNL